MKNTLTIIIDNLTDVRQGTIPKLLRHSQNSGINIIFNRTNENLTEKIKEIETQYFLVLDTNYILDDNFIEKLKILTSKNVYYYFLKSDESKADVYIEKNHSIIYKQAFSRYGVIYDTKKAQVLLSDTEYDDLYFATYIAFYNLNALFCINIKAESTQQNIQYFGKEINGKFCSNSIDFINTNRTATVIFTRQLLLHVKYCIENNLSLNFEYMQFSNFVIHSIYMIPHEEVYNMIIEAITAKQVKSTDFKILRDSKVVLTLEDECESNQLFKLQFTDCTKSLTKSYQEKGTTDFNQVDWYKPIDTNSIFLVMDRSTDADDNGEAFYRFMKEQYPEYKNVYFILAEDSKDWNRLEYEGFKLVKYNTPEFRSLFIKSDVFISSQAYSFSVKHNNLIKSFKNSRFVYLQHGVIYNDMSTWIKTKKFDLFVTSTDTEEALISKILPRETVQSGLSRYQYLEKVEKNVALYAPTWRFNLKQLSDSEFVNSQYFKKNISFLNNCELESYLSSKEITLKFKIHPNFADRSQLFKKAITNPHVKITSEDYKTLLCESMFVVSDYSSLIYDAKFLNTPIYLYQYDNTSFYEGQPYDLLDKNILKEFATIEFEEHTMIESITNEVRKHSDVLNNIDKNQINQKILERILEL